MCPNKQRIAHKRLLLMALSTLLIGGLMSVGIQAAPTPTHPGFVVKVSVEPDPCEIGVDDAPVTETGELTSDGVSSFFRSTSTYASAPAYKEPASSGSKVDYDAAGNQIVWRTLETQRLVSPGEVTELRLHEVMMVTPAGEIREMPGIHTQRLLLPSGKGDLNDNQLMLLALGVEDSKLIDDLHVSETRDDGSKFVSGRGKLGSETTGVWDVEVGAEGLVRRAVFSGQIGPLVSIESSGTISAGSVTVAERGTVIFGRSDDQPLSVTYKVDDLSLGFDPRLAKQILNSVHGPLPYRAEITDLRQRPIKRTFVDEIIVEEEEEVPDEEERPCCECQGISTSVSECGHLPASVNCSSDWCITNTFNTATCAKTADTGVPACNIVSPIPPQAEVVQVPTLLANGGCATGGNPVVYGVKFTFYDGCSGCTPTFLHRYRTACELAGACPAGVALNRCASPRGIRRACG